MLFQLDEFFKRLNQDMPKLKPIIKEYQDKLAQFKDNPINVLPSDLTNGEIQVYEQTFYVAEKSYYTIRWNVAEAYRIAKQHFPLGPNVNLYLPTIAQCVREESISHSRLKHALHNNEPIIVGYHAGLRKAPFVLIDGNHRVISKHQHGELYFKGYVLKCRV